MNIIGCDFHTSFQRVEILDTESGEIRSLQLTHREEAIRFYQELEKPVRVGIEACGYSQWFERVLGELGHEVWIGNAGEIRASVARKQKTDKRDAEHLLKLLVEGRFPRIWVPSPEERDVKQLLRHRQGQVQERTRVKNQLQAIALSDGLRLKRKLWTRAGRQQFDALSLRPFAAQRRAELLARLEELDRQIEQLNQRVAEAGAARPQVALLRTHPGVGPVLALAWVVTMGPIERFARSRQVASYVGLIPSEYSSGGRQRLGSISKQGNALLRSLLVEGAQSAVRKDAPMRQAYGRIARKHHRAVAKVALARQLAVRMYWMLRRNEEYPAVLERGSM